jgi:preprotein translocase subunit SecG
MGLIGVVLIVIMVISAVLLVLLVLVQDEQGEGIGGIFGGGSSTPFGSRSGNVLTRFTAVLATVFLVSIFALAWVSKSQDVGNVIGASRAQSLSTTGKQTWYEPTNAAGTSSESAPAAGTASGASAGTSTTPAGGN